jgi:hypothetical protein
MMTEQAVAEALVVHKQGVDAGIQAGWLMAIRWLNERADTWDKFQMVGEMMNIDPLTLRKELT